MPTVPLPETGLSVTCHLNHQQARKKTWILWSVTPNGASDHWSGPLARSYSRYKKGTLFKAKAAGVHSPQLGLFSFIMLMDNCIYLTDTAFWSMLPSHWQSSWGINTRSFVGCIAKDNMADVWSHISFSPATLISRREEIDLQIKMSGYCTGSKLHCVLRHGCKTDTCFHAWLNSSGGIWLHRCRKLKCQPPTLPLSFQAHTLKRKSSLPSENCWVSRGCAIDICPGSIALAVQPPLKSDKRHNC